MSDGGFDDGGGEEGSGGGIFGEKFSAAEIGAGRFGDEVEIDRSVSANIDVILGIDGDGFCAVVAGDIISVVAVIAHALPPDQAAALAVLGDKTVGIANVGDDGGTLAE